ncbi:MAG: hypothetical protein P8103_19810, partial [Candidatus Thiodiazotropha sp.]
NRSNLYPHHLSKLGNHLTANRLSALQKQFDSLSQIDQARFINHVTLVIAYTDTDIFKRRKSLMFK